MTVEDRGILGWRDGGAGDTEAMTAVIGARMRERESSAVAEGGNFLTSRAISLFHVFNEQAPSF